MIAKTYTVSYGASNPIHRTAFGFVGGKQSMRFRDLSVLKRRSGMLLWPPQWASAYRPKQHWPHGEIGTLEDVWMHELLERCVFLHIKHNGFRYAGSMDFDERASCMMVYKFLKSVVGHSTVEIGDSDVAHLL